ncbi:cell division protein FtsZ [Cetobacterium sp.]|uniref:cell division protein FtsZ n=1 Tax=Cetobacterium sp. TaxID=2071632 RepID=UPI0025FB41E8|nr:cell division protein FtsZ [uncultured Cetobacterium sp.]
MGNNKFNVNIKVMGIGGGGINALDEIISSEIDEVSFFAVNTDLQDLNNSKTPHKVQLGPTTTKGLGCGGNLELGEKATKESLSFIKSILKGTDFLFLTSTMGGGTGSAATSLIAKVAKEMNILTVAIVTKPFSFEGRRRMKIAEIGIKNLTPFVDSLIVIPNDKLLENSKPNITVQEAFKKSNQVLFTAVKGMTDLMLAKGLINLDFADIKSLLLNSGEAILGFGEGSGENRAYKAAIAAVDSSLFERTMMGATKLLVNIIGPKDLNLMESSVIVDTMKQECAADIDDVLFGVSIDDNSLDTLKVILVANTFSNIKKGL